MALASILRARKVTPGGAKIMAVDRGLRRYRTRLPFMLFWVVPCPLESNILGAFQAAAGQVTTSSMEIAAGPKLTVL